MLSIIYEDNYLLAVNKPAGLQVEADRYGNPSLEEQISAYLKKTYPWKKQLICGIPHRLDRAVSGVILFAIAPMALKEIRSQFEKGEVGKTYLALTEKVPAEKAAKLVNWLCKDDKNRCAVITTKKVKSAKEARLIYKVLYEKEGKGLLQVDLDTGRYHQIRAQLSAIGCPILGDVKYGSNYPGSNEMIYLHAHQLRVKHPKTGEPVVFSAPIPSAGEWLKFNEIIQQ